MKKWWKRLHPLWYYGDWEMVYNHLENINPEDFDKDDAVWQRYFAADILRLTRTEQRRQTKKEHKLHIEPEKHIYTLDFGWYPAGNPTGSYKIVYVVDGNYKNPISEFQTRNTQEAIDKIEYLLLGRDMKYFHPYPLEYPLRLAPGWQLHWHHLEPAIEPKHYHDNDESCKEWLMVLDEDVSYFTKINTWKRNNQIEEQLLAIDVGWYGSLENIPAGYYRVLAILDADWAHPILEFRTNSAKKALDKVEEWMFDIFLKQSFINEKTFRKAHPNK